MMKKIYKVITLLIITIALFPLNIFATTLQEFEDQLTKYQSELEDKNNQISVSKKEFKRMKDKDVKEWIEDEFVLYSK